MRILNFGSCNIDYVYSLPHMVRPGETLSAEKMEIFPGGKGLNQSIAAARAGATISHAGLIGEDGEFLKALLQESGADTSLMESIPMKNGHAIIQVDPTGENSIFIFKGSNGVITEEYIDRVLSHFDQGDLLLLQNEINLLDRIIEKAAEKGLQIALNPSPFHENLKKLDLNKITYLILNKVEAAAFSEKEDSLSDLLARFPTLKIIQTLGKGGSVYRDREQEFFCPAYRVKAVDTTAAGDTFTGYFFSLLAKGAAIPDALKKASAASALSVSKMGAAPSIPKIEEVEKALPALTPYNDAKKERLRREILQYLENHLTDASLEGLAEELGYSKGYIGNLIKDTTGKSFSALLQEMRCKQAAALLSETELPITEIIRLCGYENESFFRKKFTARFSLTPLQYRKRSISL